jgi:hypothetical protein
MSGRVEIGLILRGVPAPDRVCLVMDVPGRMIRVQNKPFDVGRTDMKHARFMVIDPDDGVIVMRGHDGSAFLKIAGSIAGDADVPGIRRMPDLKDREPSGWQRTRTGTMDNHPPAREFRSLSVRSRQTANGRSGGLS